MNTQKVLQINKISSSSCNGFLIASVSWSWLKALNQWAEVTDTNEFKSGTFIPVPRYNRSRIA